MVKRPAGGKPRGKPAGKPAGTPAGTGDAVHIVVSDQPLLMERAVRALVDAAVPESARGFNYDIVEGKTATAARIIAAAQTLPMMAQRRLVLVRGLDQLSAAEQMKLVPYLDSPNPSTTLVATADKLDKRTKFYTALSKRKLIHELSVPKNLGDWAAHEAAERDIAMEPRAAARLADVIGKDLARMALAVEQLGLYAGDRAITGDDVDDLIADTRERSVFELIDAIGAGKRAAALAAVGRLCEQRQSAIGVVVMLARFMRQIGLCHQAQARRLPNNAAASLIGVPHFLVSRLMAQARRYPAWAVPVAITRLAQTDRALKGHTRLTKVLGGELGERVLLDRVVNDILALGQA
jgi:DNA polymerase-3 subunit delta